MIHGLVIVISQIPHDINFQLAPFCFENFAIGICQIETQTHTHNDDKDGGDDNVDSDYDDDDDDGIDDDDDGVEDDSQGMNYKSGAFAQWETVGAFGAKSLFKVISRM